MRKQVKLNKKTGNTTDKAYGILATEHCTGKQLAVVTTLKMLEMILVTIFGLFLGIFAPLCVFMGIDDADPAAIRAAVFWLISSVLYLGGFFALMLGNSKIAAIVHAVASVGTLITYSTYQQLYADNPNVTGPSILYMPCLFITLFTLAIMLTINIPKWVEKREKMLVEQAPSILEDDNDNNKKE